MEEEGGGGGYGEVSPPEKATPSAGTIRDKADALWDLVGMITGNAGDIRAAFSGMASQFSDLVRADIFSEGEYDQHKWEQASLALAFGAEVAYQWADDVERYDEDRLELYESATNRIRGFRSFAPTLYEYDTGKSPYVQENSPFDNDLPLYPHMPDLSPYGSHNPDADQVFTADYIAWRDGRIQEMIQEYNAESEALQQALVETGTDRTDTLKLGPENDASIRQLVDAGYFGWTVFNIIGPEGDPPLPVSEETGRQMATELNDYIYGDREPDARFGEILNTLAAIMAKAKAMQTLDDELDRLTGNPDLSPPSRYDTNNLRDNEIDFLSTLLGDLDEHVVESPDNNQPLGGLVYLPRLLDGPFYEQNIENPLERDQLEQVLGALGAGMLIVSNEELGGGYDRLPESVRTLADGNAVYTVNGIVSHEPEANPHGWMQGAEYLDRFLGNADQGLRGGREFSANLITSMGHNLNGIDNDYQYYDQGLSSLLDVATRNEDAGYEILSDRHDHPTFEHNANALKGLFTHDWADDGEALSGLTGWIPEAAESPDATAQRRAMEASLGLMETLTGNPDRLEALQDTGVTVELADGEKVDGAAFTLLNPELAASVTDVATTYLFDLSLPGPADGHMDGASVFEIFSNSDVSDRDLLQVDLQSRQKFFSLLMADDASATHLYSTLNHLEAAGVHPLMEQDGAMESAGSQRGTLRGLFDSALRLEALHRTGQDLEDQGAPRQFGHWRTGAFAATGFFKHPAIIAGTFVAAGASFHEYDLRNYQDISPNYQAISDIGITDPNNPFAPNEYGRTLQTGNVEYKTQLDMLDWQVRNNSLSIEDVRAHDERLVAEDGESVIDYTDFDQFARDVDARQDGPAVSSSLRSLLEEIGSVHPVLGSPNTALNEANSFTNSYVASYEDVFNRTFPDVSLDEAEEFWKTKPN